MEKEPTDVGGENTDIIVIHIIHHKPRLGPKEIMVP